jgi:DhnA family fructose-bisphosphate aldolase class Ia
MLSRITGKFLPCDGKISIVAMDHGMTGAVDGFKNPEVTLKKVLSGKPDGILVSPNFARNFCYEFNANPHVRLIIRVDMMGTSTLAGVEGKEELQFCYVDVEQALNVRADAIMSLFIYGREDKSVLLDNMKYLAALSEKSHRYNVPHIMEVPFWGKMCPVDDAGKAKLLENACRVAFELGADMIKAPYLANNRDAFVNITSNLPIPIIVLGGAKTDSEKDLLTMVKNALDDGARGVAIGRNVWQSKSPDKMCDAINQIIHKGISVTQGLEILQDR